VFLYHYFTTRDFINMRFVFKMDLNRNFINFMIEAAFFSFFAEKAVFSKNEILAYDVLGILLSFPFKQISIWQFFCERMLDFDSFKQDLFSSTRSEDLLRYYRSLFWVMCSGVLLSPFAMKWLNSDYFDFSKVVFSPINIGSLFLNALNIL